jgi:Flp pilus assembly protein TadD
VRRINLACALCSLLMIGVSAPARADQVAIAPGVSVTRKVYAAPQNEAPFYNFDTSPELKRYNDDFVSAVTKQNPDRSQVAEHAIGRGWEALIGKRDVATAAKRFNQAFLLDPQQSGVYHGLAAVVADRFRDFDFADELFRVAARMKAPAQTLSADHGRVLLIAGRPSEAKPLLERAVRDNPDWAVPHSNLAFALLQTGDAAEACRAAAKVTGRDRAAVERDLALLKQQANCR